MASNRYLEYIAVLIVLFQIFFLFVSDNHIVANSNNFHYLGREGGDANGDLHRQGKEGQQKQIEATATTISKYKPDYTKFNTSHPPILYASSPGSLYSLPDSNRIPRHVVESQKFTEYYSNWNPENDPHSLFVYNPSMVSLFPSAMSQPLENNFQYLATFRVSSIHSCGFPTYEFWNHPVDYVGIALMDKNLKVAKTWESKAFDFIVDINAQLPEIYGGAGKKMKFQDVRLFNLHDRVYLSSGVYLIPICVKIDWSASSEKGLGSSPAICKDEDEDFMTEIRPFRRKEEFLHLYVTGDAIRMKDTNGKNFQFFHAPSSTPLSSSTSEKMTNNVLMEYWPMGPREVHDLGHSIAKVHLERQKEGKRVVDVMRLSEIKSDVAPNPKSKVAASLDSSLKTFIQRDRSSACCIQIEKKHYVDILPSFPPSSRAELNKLNSFMVGISHSKSRGRMPSSQEDRYNYLSRFYAFASFAPYDLIARSGLFCLGFPGDGDAKSEGIPGSKRGIGVGGEYNNMTKGKRLDLYGKSYMCPNIHFVDSIIEKVGDDSRVIVSYGVNDCVPRFLELSKQDLVIHLFSE